MSDARGSQRSSRGTLSACAQRRKGAGRREMWGNAGGSDTVVQRRAQAPMGWLMARAKWKVHASKARR
jgi:hypothetical protein